MFNSVFRDILPTLRSPNAGFLPTPPNGISFRRRCAKGYTGYFIISVIFNKTNKAENDLSTGQKGWKEEQDGVSSELSVSIKNPMNQLARIEESSAVVIKM